MIRKRSPRYDRRHLTIFLSSFFFLLNDVTNNPRQRNSAMRVSSHLEEQQRTEAKKERRNVKQKKESVSVTDANNQSLVCPILFSNIKAEV